MNGGHDICVGAKRLCCLCCKLQRDSFVPRCNERSWSCRAASCAAPARLTLSNPRSKIQKCKMHPSSVPTLDGVVIAVCSGQRLLLLLLWCCCCAIAAVRLRASEANKAGQEIARQSEGKQGSRLRMPLPVCRPLPAPVTCLHSTLPSPPPLEQPQARAGCKLGPSAFPQQLRAVVDSIFSSSSRLTHSTTLLPPFQLCL